MSTNRIGLGIISSVRAILAIARKDFRIAITYRIGFALAVFSTLWGITTFRLISKLITGGQFATATDYFDFVVIGLLIGFVVEPVASAGASAVRQDQTQGTLEYIATLPVSRLVLGIGWSAYSLIQSVIMAGVLLVITAIFGFRVSHVNVPVLVTVIVLTLLIFMAIGNFGSAMVLSLQQGMGLVTAAVGVLGLLGGTLFPTSEFPAWMNPLVKASPLTYSLAALRAAVLSGARTTSTSRDIVILGCFALVLVPMSWAALELSFRWARRRGTLSTF